MFDHRCIIEISNIVNQAPSNIVDKSTAILVKLAKLANLINNMQIINIHKAKTNLSKLIEKTQNGEEVIIAKAGKPVVKLVPFKEKLKPRKPGLWKGKIWIADDFDEEDEEINKLFYGEE